MEPQAGRRISPFRATKRSNHSLRKTTRRSRVRVQTIGTECRNKKVSAPSRRRDMSLDISFYRTSPITAQSGTSWFAGCVVRDNLQIANKPGEDAPGLVETCEQEAA